ARKKQLRRQAALRHAQEIRRPHRAESAMNEALAEHPPTRQAVAAPPCALVIFGAGGDLTKRLLVPALSNLLTAKLLPEHFTLIGVARTELSPDAFRDNLEKAVAAFGAGKAAAAGWAKLAERIDYIAGDFADFALYRKIEERLARAARDAGTEGNCLFYLAT